MSGRPVGPTVHVVAACVHGAARRRTARGFAVTAVPRVAASRDAAGIAHLPTPAPPRPSAPGQPSPDDVATLKNLLGERDTMVRPDLEATIVNVSLGIRHITLVSAPPTCTALCFHQALPFRLRSG